MYRFWDAMFYRVYGWISQREERCVEVWISIIYDGCALGWRNRYTPEQHQSLSRFLRGCEQGQALELARFIWE
jgi:hypothetical protein